MHDLLESMNNNNNLITNINLEKNWFKVKITSNITSFPHFFS